MKIAIEGCAHGELDKIYDVIAYLEEKNDIKIDLLLICGDFQAVRNETDLECMAVPTCYRRMQTFYKYYSGEKVAPILTIFIGGNHEASNYLTELNYGGWVCPNIYYLGKAGVIQVGGLRIAGCSGIYNGSSYLKGAYETPPYDRSSLRTVYHVRNLEVYRLGLLREPIDIMLSHDWPRGIYSHGDTSSLLKRKPFFKEEIDKGSLGSAPAEKLLNKLKPKYWFSAHLHCKFAALVAHEDGRVTKFLALDKCLPNRRFLQIADIETKTEAASYHICHDLEWLAILRETNSLLNFTTNISALPDPSFYDDFFKEISVKRREIHDLLTGSEASSTSDGDEGASVDEISPKPIPVSTDFEVSVTPYSGVKSDRNRIPTAQLLQNKQTTRLCKILGLTDPVEKLLQIRDERSGTSLSISSLCGDSYTYSEGSSKNPEEIDLDSDDGDDDSKKTNEPVDLDSDVDVPPEEGEFNLFIIDKKPASSTPFKRLAMRLPPPRQEKLDDSNFSTTSVDVTSDTFDSSFETTFDTHASTVHTTRDTPGTTMDRAVGTPDTTDSTTKRLCSDSRNITSSDTTGGTDNVTPERKVFKRRNQAMYATKDSDESN